jgi:predicted dehydrogenase
MKQNERTQKILFTGYGNIAVRHIQNIKFLLPNSEVKVLRLFSKEPIWENTAIAQTFFDINEALQWKPEIVFITSPAPLHIDNAINFAEVGSHLYIEKPLSNSICGINELETKIASNKLISMIGYNLRFNKALLALRETISNNTIGRIYSVKAEVGQWLPSWRQTKDYRKTVTARKVLGGGTILELSHDIDYLRFVFGEISTVTCVASKQSDLDIDVEDNAEILLKFHNGIIANLHLDLLRHDTTRTCTVLGKKGTLILDFISCSLKMFSAVTNEWTDLYINPLYDSNEAYIDCLTNFTESIKNNRPTFIPISEGIKTLKAAMAAKESNSEKRTVFL